MEVCKKTESLGVMEYWSCGVMKMRCSKTPRLQECDTTPILQYLNTDY